MIGPLTKDIQDKNKDVPLMKVPHTKDIRDKNADVPLMKVPEELKIIIYQCIFQGHQKSYL